MIGRAMETWPDDALRRVVDAPIEEWDTGTLSSDGKRCLLGHAVSATPTRRYIEVGRFLGLYRDTVDPEAFRGGIHLIALRFDELCNRFTIPRTVRAIKARALRILLERHPMEPVAPALTETV